MASTTTKSNPTSPPSSSSAVLKSLDRRVTALSIEIATDRADAREKIPRIAGTWVKNNEYTLELDRIQIAMEKDWIDLREASVEEREEFVDMMEREYEELMVEWRADGKV